LGCACILEGDLINCPYSTRSRHSALRVRIA
jgi:hypothetical protein